MYVQVRIGRKWLTLVSVEFDEGGGEGYVPSIIFVHRTHVQGAGGDVQSTYSTGGDKGGVRGLEWNLSETFASE